MPKESPTDEELQKFFLEHYTQLRQSANETGLDETQLGVVISNMFCDYVAQNYSGEVENFMLECLSSIYIRQLHNKRITLADVPPEMHETLADVLADHKEVDKDKPPATSTSH